MAVTASVDGETVGCSAYSYTAHGNWDRRLSKSEKAAPRTRGQRMGREEFPAWPALQQQRREAEHKEQEAAALAATRFAPALARAVKAAEEIIADPSSTTFRTLERRRQAVCVAMEEQARRTVAARLKSADSWGYSAAEDELKRLLQLTQELFKALPAAEEPLPPDRGGQGSEEPLRRAYRPDRDSTLRLPPTSGDGAYTERHALDAARQRLEQS
jgi:hypothetical protein